VEDGKLTVAEGFGVRSAESRETVDADTLFRIGSVSKPFAALTLLRLVDSGRVQLDMPASAYLPAFKADPRITPRHLVSMTSGLADLIVPKPGRGADAAALFAAEITTLSWEPGRFWSYSNPGFAAAGAVIQAAGGATFETQADAALRALGMERSTFDIGQVLTRPHTVPHRLKAGQAEVIRPDTFADVRHDAAAGMMFSTARELGGFAEWLLRGPGAGGAISPGAFAEMKRPVLGMPPVSHGYGLGLTTQRIRGEPVIGHSGAIWGHEAVTFVAPERGFGVALMVNAQDSGIMFPLLDHALERVGGVAPAKPQPAVRRADHLGRYETRHPLTGERFTPEVVAAGEGIAVRRRDGTLGPVALPFRPDVYRTADGALAVFLRDGSGQVVASNRGSRNWIKVA
jgi:CubicO group peptidase (beta-lactamase class C family)